MKVITMGLHKGKPVKISRKKAINKNNIIVSLPDKKEIEINPIFIKEK